MSKILRMAPGPNEAISVSIIWVFLLPGILVEKGVNVSLCDLHGSKRFDQFLQKLDEKVFDLFVVRKPHSHANHSAGETFEAAFKFLTSFGGQLVPNH